DVRHDRLAEWKHQRGHERDAQHLVDDRIVLHGAPPPVAQPYPPARRPSVKPHDARRAVASPNAWKISSFVISGRVATAGSRRSEALTAWRPAGVREGGLPGGRGRGPGGVFFFGGGGGGSNRP